MDNSTTPIIRTQQLTKEFEEFTAVKDINLNVSKGEIFAFIGPSGCGKTTTIRMLVGTYKPTSGTAEVWGKPATSFTLTDQEKIGYMPQLFVLYSNLTIWENMNFAASLYGVPWRRKKRLQELLELVELNEHSKKKVSDISGGMKKRLSLAATLIHEPELMFLDEPTSGIDPILRRKIWDHFTTLQKKGHTLFITTQHVEESERADKVGLMSAGRLIAVDDPLGLRRQGLGGDGIHIHPAVTLTDDVVDALRQQPFVISDLRPLGRRKWEITVEEADKALPLIFAWFKQREINLESVNQHYPPYEEVFVRLIENSQSNQSDQSKVGLHV